MVDKIWNPRTHEPEEYIPYNGNADSDGKIDIHSCKTHNHEYKDEYKTR